MGVHGAHVKGTKLRVRRKSATTEVFIELEGAQRPSKFGSEVGIRTEPRTQESCQQVAEVGIRGNDWSDRVPRFVQFILP